MRGGGLSDRDVPPFRFEELVDDFGELVDQLGLKKFPLMTLEGFAAPIAIGYAARHPERVERLVMHSSYAKGTLLGDPEQRRVVADYTLNFGFPSSSSSTTRELISSSNAQCTTCTSGLLPTPCRRRSTR